MSFTCAACERVEQCMAHAGLHMSGWLREVATSSRRPAVRASFSASSNRPAGIPVVSMLFTGSRKPSSATCVSVNRKATCGAAVGNLLMNRTVSAWIMLV